MKLEGVSMTTHFSNNYSTHCAEFKSHLNGITKLTIFITFLS